MNDVVINKIQSMQRYIARAREEYEFGGNNFATSATHQDAAVLNITRACELAIDLANHLIKTRKLGIPTDSRQSFELLAQANLLSQDSSRHLQSMVGFRNIAVHDYRELDITIVSQVIEDGLDDLLTFADQVRRVFE
jgi:uncharacterized protein YutE (UPF0331/DUF86 family)